MSFINKIFAVFFYSTLIFEFLFNISIIIFVFSIRNLMPAFIIIYGFILVAGCVGGFVFAVKGSWKWAFWFTFGVAVLLFACALNEPGASSMDADSYRLILIKYHLHIFVPCLFALFNFIGAIIKNKKEIINEKNTESKII